MRHSGEISVGYGRSRVRGGQAHVQQEPFRTPVRDQTRRDRGYQQVFRVVIVRTRVTVLTHKSKYDRDVVTAVGFWQNYKQVCAGVQVNNILSLLLLLLKYRVTSRVT